MMSTQELETISLQWQETIKVLIQSFNKIIIKYITASERVSTLNEKIYQKSFFLFRITNRNVFNEVTLVIKSLLNTDILDARKKQTVLKEIELWLRKNKNQGQAVHEIMCIIMIILEDATFIQDKDNFTLLLSIYIEIFYFPALSDEYSTYFYNLELLCKKFMKQIFAVVFEGKDDNADLQTAFVEFVSPFLTSKLLSNKANEAAIIALQVFFDEFVVYGNTMSPCLFVKLYDKLFSLLDFRNDRKYHQIVDSESLCIYVLLYEHIKRHIALIMQKEQ